MRLDGKNGFDEDSFDKIMKTLVGIANLRVGLRGYVLVGVADRAEDARRVTELFGVDPKPFERFFITGVEHEANALGKNLDQLFQEVTERVRASSVSEPLKDFIARHIKCVRYYDKTVFVFEAQAQQQPSNYEGRFYVRHGNMLAEVPVEQYGGLFARFQAGL